MAPPSSSDRRQPPPPAFFTPSMTYYDPPMGSLPPPPPSSFSSVVPPPPPFFTPYTTYNYDPPMGSLPPPPSSSSSVVPPPASPLLLLLQETQELRNNILNQIEYYFSDDNLARDVHLKQHMDDNGWVPITLIASFPRVAALTKDIGLILFTLISSSQIVEVEGKKVRRRATWNKWLLDATMRMQRRWNDNL